MTRIDDLINRYYSDVLIGQRALETAIHEAVSRGGTRVLDAGCGTDAPLTRKLGDQAWVVGVDLCELRPTNLAVVRGDLSKLPFQDEAFSLIFSRSVFEHLPEPTQVIDEFQRVLRPNGVCIILTPNRFDYSSVVAALTPQWFHEWFVGKVYGSTAYDTFPTVYRANTPAFFRSLVKCERGWRIKRLSGVRHYPANLAFSRLLFRLGVLYDWMIASGGLTALQPSLLVELERTG
jgi:ubiquinone/menaquinone biosynthesis C-methylase UbiE